jgi:DNA replication and repair protein RecF
LRKAAAGFSSHDALAPWTEQVLTLGSALQRLREETLAVLSPRFSEAAEALGLPSCRLEYVGEPLTAKALERRLVRDLERGTTGLGPHVDEISVLADTRDLRIFGSQGEQRIAVLALLLAEAELLTETAEISPLLLLDDVLSELDLDRRLALVAWIGRVAQTVVTATSERSLPLEPSQLVRVEPGIAEVA